jgi:hypothetical protein
MDLLDRYLHAVRFWLPRAQQDDITAELAEDLRSQIEDQETKLGRKLNESEIASLLRERGRPMFVANRYLPQQYLVGPVLFPVYKFVLKIVVLCYLIPWLLVWIGLVTFDASYRSAHRIGHGLALAWPSFWLVTFMAVGAVTIVFAVLERFQSKTKFLENWDPRRLRPVRDPNRIPRFNSVFELAANGIFIVWWLNGMWSQTLFDRAGVRIVLAPVWKVFFWAFLWIAVANIALAAVNLSRPYWTWLRAVLRLLFESAGAVAICWLSKVNILAQIVLPNLAPTRAAEIVNAINLNLLNSFPIAVFGCILIVALSSTARLIRLRTNRTRLMHGVAL